MPKITIGSNVIDFPNTGSDAVWSEPVVDFAVAVEGVLSSISNENDITPNVYDLPTLSGFNVIDSKLFFDSGVVRSFVFTYSINRVGAGISGKYIYETGTVTGVYNQDPGPNGGWKINQEFIGDKLPNGSLYNEFAISNGTLQIKLQDIGATAGKISCSAKTLLKVY
jgi:hypothetical protein